MAAPDTHNHDHNKFPWGEAVATACLIVGIAIAVLYVVLMSTLPRR